MIEPRKPRGLIAFLTTCALVGLVALLLSVNNALALGRESDQREAERVASDVKSCERGNVFRQSVLTIGAAQEALVDGILDRIFTTSAAQRTPEQQANVEALRASLAPLFTDYEKALATITLTDCKQAVPGA